MVGVLVAFGINQSKAADSSSETKGKAKSSDPATGNSPAGVGVPAADRGSTASVGGGPSSDLAGTYVIDFLSLENAGDKTLYIKDPKGKISATWDCMEHGFQELTNVSFDGEVLTFTALSGTPGDEYFYFHLDSFGDYLLCYAKTQEGHKSPIVARAVK